ncbi:hypothetical protein FACS1894201_03370 [Bacteroidia bacterium]|nr:hypothetical protein FACS1894201_03370 [Bacteroidia bacterium]
MITLLFGGSTIRVSKGLSFKFPAVPFSEQPTAPVVTDYDENVDNDNDDSFLTTLAADYLKSSLLDYPELAEVSTYPIEIPDHCLDVFFDHLAQLGTTSEMLRILHYGDSQIEGDRISSTIRRLLQASFGGNGCGLLQITTPIGSPYYSLSLPEECEKINITTAPRNVNNFSPTMGYLITKKQPVALTIQSLRSSKKLTTQEFCTVKVITNNAKDVVCRTPILNKQQFKHHFYALTNFSVDPSTRSVQLQLPDNTMVYGISLDANAGIILDNLPLRGSAGYIFTRNHPDFLKEGLEVLGTKLILFQFGINAIPQQYELSTNITAFENALSKQLEHLRQLAPDIPIIVISASDRSILYEGTWITNPNVPKFVEAQRRAALNNHCAFWNLYKAMGGANSMQQWEQRTPALATKDYIHFTAKGAEQVGQLFYKSFISAYLDYNYRQYLTLQ